MKYRPLIRGIIGYIPGVLDLIKNRKEHTGTTNADYCYSVWLRHFSLLRKAGIDKYDTVAEIGPGASLGIGLTSLLFGAKRYYAFDLIKHSEIRKNVEIFNQLVKLANNQADVPSEINFPKVKPRLDSYLFKDLGFTESFIDENLEHSRISAIQKAIANINYKNIRSDFKIEYIAPWYLADVNSPIDLIFSQAVLEHIDDLEFAVGKMVDLLKNGGVMSHVIDYTAHETHEIWNGHWIYPEYLWRIISKGRSYPLNRKPHSYYLDLFKRQGLEILFMQPSKQFGGISYQDIPLKNRHNFKESDFEISGCYFILKKH